jgi:peptidoglycan/LPS O-acetylase OafA/YrhL
MASERLDNPSLVAHIRPLEMTTAKLPQLDVLRGACALLVVFYHVPFRHPGFEWGGFRNGSLFVDFFFVLSGFIMFHNYRSLPAWSDVRRFMGLRFFRVYPLHLVMIAVFGAYETLQYALVQLYHLSTNTPPFSENNWSALLLNLILLNGVGIVPLTFNVPSWSISVEFWTYAMFGVSVFALGARRAALLAVFLGIALGSLALLATRPVPGLTLHSELFLPRCMFGFFLGAALRMSFTRPLALETANSLLGNIAQWASLMLAVGLVSVVTNQTRWLELFTPFAFALMIACFVAWPNTGLIRFANSGPLLWLGKVSYSIYMVHMIVLLVIGAVLRVVFHAPLEGETIRVNEGFGSVALLVSIASVLVLAAITHRFVEEPGRRFGRALLGGRRTAGLETQAARSAIQS